MLFGNTLLGHEAVAVVDSARAALEEQFSSSLRDYARSSGWPDDVASGLSMKAGEQGFDVAIPESLEARAMDLEYGTQKSAPTAVLRKFQRRLGRSQTADPVLAILGSAL